MSRFYLAAQRAKGAVTIVDRAGPSEPEAFHDIERDLTPSDLDRVGSDAPDIGAASGILAEPARSPNAHLLSEQEPVSPLSTALPAASPLDPSGPTDTIPQVHPAYERITQRLITFRSTIRRGAILVVSAVHGEGASTVARNLAFSLARETAAPVALVDANLRSPCQHRHFDMDLSTGFAEVVDGRATLVDSLRRIIEHRVSLLTAGNVDGRASHVVTRPSVEGIVSGLLTTHRWVVLDSSPVTSHPDASNLAEACGGALLVIKAERTRVEVAEEAKRILEQTGVEIVGAVLNRRKYHIPEWLYRRL